jgi:hypothetical protein
VGGFGRNPQAHKIRSGHSLGRIQTTTGDSGLKGAHIHNSVLFFKNVGEALFRQTAVKRHLPPLKPIDGNTGTGGLAFTTTTTGFTFSASNTTTHAHQAATGAFVIPNSV